MAIYLSGSTIVLKGKFTTPEGKPVDPAIVKIRIRDSKYNILHEGNATLANKLDTGIYFYNYTIPVDMGNDFIYYEWWGELDGYPALNRKRLATSFVK